MPVLSTDTARLNGMPKPSAATTPFHLVYGGDSYLNDQTVRDLKHEAQRRYPDAETIELDAANADHYAFDEAVSPSLLADRAIVIVTNLQNADEKLGDAMVSYCRQACKEPADACIVICQHEGGVKGKRLVEQLTKAGAYKDAVADLKKPEAKLNFVMQCFERRKRRVEPMAAQQLVAVLGDRTGELAAMVGQLCFDFDDNPMTLDRVNQYLTSNPQVDGFRVADLALSGRTADAIIAMRSSVEQGTAPIALIGALAMKLRTMAKASAVRAGTISTAEAKTNPWVLKNATRQLSGWTSSGMSACIQMLAWADEQSKTNGSDHRTDQPQRTCRMSNTITITAATGEDMQALGERLAKLARGGDVLLLSGPLGAGKTTFAQGFGAGLGIGEPIVSPTFTIARELEGRFADGSPAHLVHVDAYRLGGNSYAPGQDTVGRLLDELESLGLDEELEDPGEHTVILMEWGEQMAAALAPERLEIHIDRPLDAPAVTADGELTSAGARTVTLVPVGAAWDSFDFTAGKR